MWHNIALALVATMSVVGGFIFGLFILGKRADAAIAEAMKTIDLVNTPTGLVPLSGLYVQSVGRAARDRAVDRIYCDPKEKP